MTKREYRELKAASGISCVHAAVGDECCACKSKFKADARAVGVATVRAFLCPNCCFLIGQVYERELKPTH